MPVRVIQGDITTVETDVVANAANARLKRGGGVDGAIHAAAGAELQLACDQIGGCPTGSAVLTRGFDLPALWVAHCVGPVWVGGRRGEDEELASCHRAALELAREKDARRITFPAISTGAFGFPLERAAPIAVETVLDYLEEHDRPEEVVFVCFDEKTRKVFQAALDQATAGPGEGD